MCITIYTTFTTDGRIEIDDKVYDVPEYGINVHFPSDNNDDIVVGLQTLIRTYRLRKK